MGARSTWLTSVCLYHNYLHRVFVWGCAPPRFQVVIGMAVYTHLSDTDLRQYLQYFSAGELIEAKGISAGTINTIYELQTTRGHYILRILEGRTRSDARFEEELLVHLHKHELAVPMMVDAGKRGHVVSINPRQQMSIFEFLPGREVAVFEISESHVQQVGGFLSQMHIACRELTRRRKNRFGRDRLLELLDICEAEELTKALRNDLLELRAEVTDYSSPKNLPRGIIHGDLFTDNVRFSHGKLCGVIDFEMASSGLLIYDIAVAICDWAFSQNTLQPTLARALVEGYCANRPLHETEKRHLYAITCFVAARFTVTRVHDFEVMVPPGADRLYKDYRHFLQRLRSLRSLGQESFDAAVFAFR